MESSESADAEENARAIKSGRVAVACASRHKLREAAPLSYRLFELPPLVNVAIIATHRATRSK